MAESKLDCADPIRKCCAMTDEEAISLAKTELPEAYNSGDVERLLRVFADSFTNMSRVNNVSPRSHRSAHRRN